MLLKWSRSAIITPRGSPTLSLITVEIVPRITPFTGNWENIRQHCLQILEPCILGDKDAILPALRPAGHGETIVVVASTNEHGASVVENRIREQLQRSERLRTSCEVRVPSHSAKLPASDCADPVEKQVQEVADSITEITMKARRRSMSASN